MWLKNDREKKKQTQKNHKSELIVLWKVWNYIIDLYILVLVFNAYIKGNIHKLVLLGSLSGPFGLEWSAEKGTMADLKPQGS